MRRTFDVAVIGAGSFGAWTAYFLRRAGVRVALVEAYGPAHSRSGSGGESRLIRVGYGGHEVYSRWSLGALREWTALARRSQQPLFHRTGVLSVGRAQDAYAAATLATLRRLDVPHERLTLDVMRERWPQCRFPGAAFGVLEPGSGVLMARRAVQALVDELRAAQVRFVDGLVQPPGTDGAGSGRLTRVVLGDGSRVRAGQFIFACGAWLPRLFSKLLRGRIVATRQEVFFFGVPGGDVRFAPRHLPAWIDFPGGIYGLPDVEARGVKIALDVHGPAFDPERSSRRVTARALAAARRALAARFPDLAEAPLVETRVCQYENTSNGDFLIDRHPHFDNVWLVGGGSGHGFKHGPAVGRYVTRLLTAGGEPDKRFRLAAKQTVRSRAVF